MRHAAAAIFLFAIPCVVVAAPPASAQSPALEQACVNVAKNFLLSPKLTTGIVQSFPELDPPGARLTFATRDNPQPVDFTNQIECEFNKAEAPFGLTRFCISNTCYSATEQEPEQRRRYLEVKALMDRQK